MADLSKMNDQQVMLVVKWLGFDIHIAQYAKSLIDLLEDTNRDSYRTLMYGFRVANNTISVFIRDLCKAILSTYAEDVINTPTEPEQWKVIAG